jgi:thioredoxin-related protein
MSYFVSIVQQTTCSAIKTLKKRLKTQKQFKLFIEIYLHCLIVSHTMSMCKRVQLKKQKQRANACISIKVQKADLMLHYLIAFQNNVNV